MNNQHINNLNNIIEHKVRLFNQIYDITVAQQKDINENEADNIEALVEQKQKLIDEIDKLDKSFLESFNKLKDELKLDSIELIDSTKHPEMKIIKDQIKNVMGIAHKTMELENSNREKLDAIFQRVKGELKQINTGKRSLKAYEAAPVYNDGIFVDKKIK